MKEVFEEPYFLPANDKLFLAQGETWVENNQQFRQHQKFVFFRNTLDYLIENDLTGAYFEFGVHRARTFTMAMSLDAFYSSRPIPKEARMQPQPGGGFFTEYVAFDSFEGFPADTLIAEHPLYRGGHTRTSEDEFLKLLTSYGQTTQRVRVVSGFYSASLSAGLAEQFQERGTLASFVTIDCNLYESYRDVLAWSDQFLQPGTVVYLDDFNSHRAQSDRGPRKAWNEFLKYSRWRFTPFLDVGWSGKSFVTQQRNVEPW